MNHRSLPIPRFVYLIVVPLMALLLLAGCRGNDVLVVPIDHVDPTDPTSPGLFEKTTAHGGYDREYLLYIPESYTGDEEVPLLFSLHGAIGTKEKQYDLSRFHEIADREGFILVTPEATKPRRVTLWNHESDPDLADDVGLVSALIDEVAKTFRIDTDRVYAAGSSNGGMMSFQLACHLSDRIAAITAVKGTMTEDQLDGCRPSRPVAVLQLHGTADRSRVRYTTVAPTLDYWIAHNRTDTTPVVTSLPDIDPNDGSTVEHYVHGNGANGATVEHFKVEGGRHDWFGEPGSNQDIDASEEAWAFFSRHDLNGRIR